MEKTTIILSSLVLVMAMALIGVFLYYNPPEISEVNLFNQQEQEEVFIETSIPEPSPTQVQRTEKMNVIYKTVEANYPSSDETTKKIIALCLSGNRGACEQVGL